jgi:hypothetical protein
MIQGSVQQFVTTIDIKAAVIKLPDQFILQPGGKKGNNNNYTVNSITTVKVH